MAVDWGRRYTSEWRVFRVDPATWADAEMVARVDSAGVERVRGGLLESGSMSVTREAGEAWEQGYYRIVLTAEQDGARERVEVATLLCERAGGEASRSSETVEVEGRSVLYPASARRLLAGTYAPMGADGAEYAAGLLRECVAAPVSVEGSFSLGSHVVFDLGDSYLDAAWAVLGAGGFCMQVDGGGMVHVLPLPSGPAVDLGGEGNKMLMPGVVLALDYSAVPNRYVADDDGVVAVAVNDDPASPVSTAARGYLHDAVDVSPRPLAGETLAAYARRKLAEASVVEDSRSYTREFWPGVYPYSVIRLSAAGVEGDLRVTRQSLKCGNGVTVTESACEEVRLWQA